MGNVDKYAVFGLLDFAEMMLGKSDIVSPVAVTVCDGSDIAQALKFVGARPLN